MLVGFLLHEGRIVLGPRFEAFLKSVSCCRMPTLMFPQKKKNLKSNEYAIVLYRTDSGDIKAPLKRFLNYYYFIIIYVLKATTVFILFHKKQLLINWFLILMQKCPQEGVFFFLLFTLSWLQRWAQQHHLHCFYHYSQMWNNNNWPKKKPQSPFGINPLLFQNSIFYNTVIFCYMCDLMGNVQCRPIMKQSTNFFLHIDDLW